MQLTKDILLTINAGSSSIKFAFYLIDDANTRLSSGHVDNIGRENTNLHFEVDGSDIPESIELTKKTFNEIGDFLLEWLNNRPEMKALKAIGHRVVYGINHDHPAAISAAVLAELKTTIRYDPEHMPGALYLIESLGKKYPGVEQIACFDSSFHSSMPSVAKMLPLPRRYFERGIRRYGFHGLSYSYLMEELVKLDGKEAGKGKVVLLHLGNGASLAAVRFGKSQDTSMGFTPASGIPMSTRSGDIDPGLAWYLMQVDNMTAGEFNHLINYESGLLGLSGSSGDIKDLLDARNTDPRAADAVDMFCYQVKKCIGAFAAALGGLDTLVFSGGIGSNSPIIREKVCRGLQFLGVQLDFSRNSNNEQIISDHTSGVKIRAMKTNEELMIARLTAAAMTFETISA